MTKWTEEFGAQALTLVASNGDLSLFFDEQGKAWVQAGEAEPIPVIRDGQQVDLARAGGWSLTAVGRDSEGNIRVLDANPASREAYGWQLDEKGAYSGESLFGDHNADVAEGIFAKDLNGDGIILSGALELVAQNDGLSLLVDSGSGLAYYRTEGGALVPILRDGANPTPLARGDWSLAAIGRDVDGNIRVLDHNPATGTSWGWIIDKGGKFGGETQYDNAANGEPEKIFQKDLNGDGYIPAADPRTIDTNGSLKLVVDRETGHAGITLENGDQVSISREGWPDGIPLTRGGYSLAAVGRDDEGRVRVLDSGGPDGNHYAWILDENGRFIGEEMFTPDRVKFAERMFNQDLDGDGELFGAPLTIIEATGTASLLKSDFSGDAYVLVNDEVVAVTREGMGPVDVTRGAWNLVAAAVDDQGRTRVLDFNPDSDDFFAWILDTDGRFVGEEVFNRSRIADAETLFEIDLDGDGVIGPADAVAGQEDWAHAA